MSQNQIRKLNAKARAVPDSHEWGYASTGAEQVGVRLSIIDGEHAGKSCVWYGYFTEKAEERTKDQLRIAGWDDTKENVIDLPGLGSTEFSLAYEEEVTPEGDVYLKGDFINRISVAMKNKMDDAQKRSFAARLRGSSTAPTPRRQNGQQQERQPGEDDIKF